MDGSVSTGKMLVRSSQGRNTAIVIPLCWFWGRVGGFREEIDENSMIEMWLLSEIAIVLRRVWRGVRDEYYGCCGGGCTDDGVVAE